MKSIVRATLGVAAVAVLGVTPASALESLTGVYQGKLKCAGLLGGVEVKAKVPVEVDVSDVGGALTLSIGDLGAFEGFAVTETKKPERGKVSAVSCPLSVVTLDGAMLHADVKIKAGSTQGEIDGTLFLTGDAEGDVRRCEIDVKRVSPVAPKLVGCP